MRASRLIALIAALLVLVAAPGGYFVYWRTIAGQVRSGVDRWAEERRADGLAIRYGPIEDGGFPFALELRLPEPELSRGGPQPFSWRGEALSAALKPWDLRDVTVRFPGRHALVLPIDGRARPVQADLAEGRLDLLLDGRGHWRALAANLARLDARLTDTNEQFRAGAARVVMRREPVGAPTSPSLLADAQVDALVLPIRQAGPLGPEVKLIKLLADVIGQAPAVPTTQAAAAWRDAGGLVDIREFRLDWGQVEIKGTGTMRLDRDLQPDLRLDTRMRGWDALIDALMMQGQLKFAEALLAKGALALLAQPSGDGGPPALRVPISVRDGNRVYLGPVRIWRLPPLLWR